MPVLHIAKTCQHEFADLCRVAMPKLSRKANVLPGVDGYLWEHKRKKYIYVLGLWLRKTLVQKGLDGLQNDKQSAKENEEAVCFLT